jgi:hypothetical protein
MLANVLFLALAVTAQAANYTVTATLSNMMDIAVLTRRIDQFDIQTSTGKTFTGPTQKLDIGGSKRFSLTTAGTWSGFIDAVRADGRITDFTSEFSLRTEDGKTIYAAVSYA